TFGGTRAVDTLSENAEIGFAIGLECNPSTVRRPNWELVPATKRQPARRTFARQIVDPQDRLVSLLCLKRELFAVRRDSRGRVRVPRQLQWLQAAAAIEHHEFTLSQQHGYRAR